MLLRELQPLDMVAYVDGYKVGSLVPTWFARHLVMDESAVDLESLEGDILHFAFFVVAIDDRHIGLLTIVADMTEGDIFDS